LRRAAGYRRLHVTAAKQTEAEVKLNELCRAFLQFATTELAADLAEFETAVRAAALKLEQVQRMCDAVCGKLSSGDARDVRLLLRPLLLDIVCRLS